jgi:hypothetical protein
MKANASESASAVEFSSERGISYSLENLGGLRKLPTISGLSRCKLARL